MADGCLKFNNNLRSVPAVYSGATRKNKPPYCVRRYTRERNSLSLTLCGTWVSCVRGDLQQVFGFSLFVCLFSAILNYVME